jgi:hypothetical protein
MKSGNLNFLEPSGPLLACNGTGLPLPLLSVTQETAVDLHNVGKGKGKVHPRSGHEGPEAE